MTITHRPNELLVRPCRQEDQAAAKQLIFAGMEEHWGYLDLTKNPDLDDIKSSYANSTFLVAWLGEELVGTGALIDEADGVARIVRMSVAKHRRRRGIGALILRHLCEHARAVGYHQIVLETTSTWDDANAFYQACKFRVTGTSDGDTHFLLDLNCVSTVDRWRDQSA